MNLYGGVFSMKRVAYSVETKMKAVEMKLAGYSTYDIMDTLNIKNKTQVKVWFKWYKNGETHRFYREVGKLSNKGQKSNELPELEQLKLDNKRKDAELEILKKYKELERKWYQK